MKRKYVKLHIDRDAEICRRYRAGETAQDIGESLQLTRQRVQQILRTAGLTAESRMTEEANNDVLGVVLTQSEKDAVREEARKRGVSMSSLTADLIRDMLAARTETVAE